MNVPITQIKNLGASMIRKLLKEVDSYKENDIEWSTELIKNIELLFDEVSENDIVNIIDVGYGNSGDYYEKTTRIIFLLMFEFANENDEKVEKLLTELKQHEDTSVGKNLIFINVMEYIAREYLQYQEYDKALKKYTLLKEIHKEGNSHQPLAFALADMAIALRCMGNHESALEHALKALEICRKYNLDKEEYMLNILASVYYALGCYDKAFENFNESLRICKVKNNEHLQSQLYNNIASVYCDISQYDKAYTAFSTALKMEEEKKDLPAQANILYNLGIVSASQNKYVQAINFYEASIEICCNLKLKKTHSQNLTELGILYLNKKEYGNSSICLNEAEILAREMKDMFQLVNIYLQKGQLFNYQGKHDESRKYLKIGLEICDKNGYSTLEKTILKELAKLENETSNYITSVKYYSRLVDSSEDFNAKDFNKRLATMQTVYEVESKEREAELYRIKTIELESKNEIINKQKQKIERALKKLKETEIRYDNINRQLKANIGSIIIGENKAVKNIITLIHKVAQASSTSILITGETGTGKELVARAIHDFSNRKSNNFCAVNVSAIPETLFESEFFGHMKNSFTGANSDKPGWFKVANQGTLFLDEISTLNSLVQSKLLRVLEDQKYTPVGSTQIFNTDIRVISATNDDIQEKISLNQFRSDLYHRLSTFVINVPPLRNRVEDIPLLLEHFVKQFSNTFGKKILKIENQVNSALMSYTFPGNVRELKNMVERAMILTNSSTLKLRHFNIPKKTAEDVEIIPLKENEKMMVIKALRKTYFHQSNAAKLLGITPKSLERRMIKYGIKKTSF